MSYLSSLDSKEIKPVNPKGNQPWILNGRTDAEAPILWPPDAKSRLIGKDPDALKDWGQEEKEAREDKVVGWRHWLNGHELEQAPGAGEGQGSPENSSWGHKESDPTLPLTNDSIVSCLNGWWKRTILERLWDHIPRSHFPTLLLTSSVFHSYLYVFLWSKIYFCLLHKVTLKFPLGFICQIGFSAHLSQRRNVSVEIRKKK